MAKTMWIRREYVKFVHVYKLVFMQINLFRRQEEEKAFWLLVSFFLVEIKRKIKTNSTRFENEMRKNVFFLTYGDDVGVNNID